MLYLFFLPSDALSSGGSKPAQYSFNAVLRGVLYKSDYSETTVTMDDQPYKISSFSIEIVNNDSPSALGAKWQLQSVNEVILYFSGSYYQSVTFSISSGYLAYSISEKSSSNYNFVCTGTLKITGTVI